MFDTLDRLFATVIEISWQAGVLVVLILLTQWVFRKRLAPKWRCAMWGLLMIRLAMPGMPESRLSVWAILDRSRASGLAPTLAKEMPAAPVQLTIVASSAVAPTVEAPATIYRIDWSRLAAIVWVLGASTLSLRATISWMRWRRRIRSTARPASRDASQIVYEQSADLGFRRKPAAFETPAITVPSVFGIIRPILLLPPDIDHSLSREQLRFVIRHELMHIRRRDIPCGVALAIFNVIHWFNPLIWIASRRYRLDRELACDAATLHGQDHAARQQYAATILKLLESLTPAPPPLAAVAVLESGSSIHQRLRAITQPARGSVILALAAVTSIGLIGCAAFSKPPQPQVQANHSPSTNVLNEREPLITRSYPVESDRQLLQQRDQWDAPARIASVTPSNAPTTSFAPVQPSQSPSLRSERTAPSTQPRDPQAIIAELIKVVDPGSWKARGGPGSADLRDGQIVIQQSPRVHEKIQSMIQFVGRQITVQTRFMTIDKPALDFERTHKEGWANYGELMLWARPLDQSDIDQILRENNASQTSTTLTAPRLTLFNGQTGKVVVATETAYVKDLIPNLGNDQPSWDPVVGLVNSGVTLDCSADIALDGQSVVLHLKPKLQRLKALTPHPVSATWQEGKIAQAFVQIPQIDVVEFDRTFRVPNNRTLLIKVGKITGEIERKGLFGSSVEPHEQNFYLLASATIVNPENQR